MVKTPVKFFVSYSHDDQALADDFLLRLVRQAAPSRRYAYSLWRDTGLLVGQAWFDQILQALQDCDLGLLLVSPSFLGSQFIGQHELPQFVGGTAKPVVPVELQPVNFDRHDLKGLEQYQLFRFDRKRAYGSFRGEARNRFVAQLFEQIELRLDQLVGTAAAGRPQL